MLNALYRAHESDKVAVRMIYIEEAHATDEWPVGSKLYAYKQTKALEERVAVAVRTKALGLETPILLDVPPANKFSELYCPWPARFYIVAPDGALVVKPKPVNGTYDTGIIWDELGRLTGK